MKQISFILCLGLLLIFSGEIRAQKALNKTVPLQVGATAPDFTLNDQNGNPITLSKTKNPVILVFYRGYW